MKIYILRHEDRTQDCSFFSPLSEKGLENAITLIKKINNCNIDHIVSSPFIRTLQTVYPFSKESKKSINIEYGLSEIHLSELIPMRSVGIKLPDYLCKSFGYNENYESIIKHNEINYPENYHLVTKRMKKILKNIISKYYCTDSNILLVTHQSLCRATLEIINNSNTVYKNTIDLNFLDNYPLGTLSLVYDNGWIFKQIN